MTRRTQFKPTTSGAVAAVLAAILAVAMLTVPSHAAPAAPVGLTQGNQRIPTLSWTHSAEATQYSVQISRTQDLTGLIGATIFTDNRHYVPTEPLPWAESGPLYWRVSVRSPSQGDWSAWTELTRSGNYDAPKVTSPATEVGTTFTQPGSPAYLTWDPVPGAREYDVQISQDRLFIDDNLITKDKTVATRYVVEAPQVATTYWFRVRAVLTTVNGGVVTNFSEPRSYRVSALPGASRTAPPTDASVVTEAILDWEPILGAKTYDLQIATDPAFGTIVHAPTNIVGTSYARPRTLDNDQYYWRVRAVDVAGNAQEWASRPTWQFERAWPQLPRPVHPALPADVDPATPNDADLGTTAGDPFYYEWEPVPHASMYQVELATDGNFSTVVGTCYTRGTTLAPNTVTNTPGNSRTCMPTDAGTYWWRVTAMDQHRDNQWRPLDYPRTSQNIFIDARFTYSPAHVSKLAPASGETVQVPSLRWSPLNGAATYQVKIWSTATGAEVVNANTAATSYTPTVKLNTGEYRWDVVSVSEDNRLGAWLLPAAQRRFVLEAPGAPVAAVPSLVSPLSGTFSRSPQLTWEPVLNATQYVVRVRPKGDGGWFNVGTYAYPQGSDAGTNFLSAGTYQWHVEALQNGSSLGVSNTGEYTIMDPQSVTGQVNALTMAGLAAGQTCTGLECTDLRQTPVLSWDPSPGVGYYRVWVSRNATFSNMVPNFELGMPNNPFPVYSTIWTPTTMLAEATAGSGYFWAVQPCYANGQCAPVPVPLNSFNKASNAVEALSPGVVTLDGVPQGQVPEVSDDVTLDWRDYLETGKAAAQGSSELSTKSTQSAREYQVQVSTDTTFSAQSILDDELVDQHSFTSFDTTYPEGNIYWRVRAIDSNQNPLPWSSVMAFKKVSPVPVPVALQGLQSSAPTLSWAPVPFAATYQVEIFQEGSNVALLTVTSKQVKWAPRSANQTLPKGKYEWRVRRADAQNRFGGWSARSPFEVATTPVTLDSPVGGAVVAPRESVLTWQGAVEATDYRVTWTSPTGSVNTTITKATSWAPPIKLSPGPWTWVVETRDTFGNVTSTSPVGSFVVQADMSATTATRIEGSGQLDTVLQALPPVWNHAPDTVTYQWFRGGTPIGDGTLSYTVTSPDVGQSITLVATASKPGYPNATSRSNAITGTQGAAPIALTPPTISGTGQVGETLTGNDPTWNHNGVAMTYRWLVDGGTAGTAKTFVVRAGDLGKPIVFEVTGKLTNYSNAVVSSAPMTATAGGALQATTTPVVSGTATVGSSLQVSQGTWSQPSPTLKYQWLRTGIPIPGATGGTYGLTPDDAGRDISVVVTATKPGFNDGAATAAAVAVSRMRSTTAGTLKSSRIKVGKRAVLSLTITVPGLATPTGVVQITDNGKKIAQKTMAPVHKGLMRVRLKKLPRGKHRLKVLYLGSDQVFGSKSKRLVLYVVR